MGPGAPEVDERITIAAPPDAVWRALTDPEERRGWWGYLDLDPVEGGHLSERWAGPGGAEVETTGTVLAVVPHRLLRVSWADETWAAPTEVEIELSSADGGTDLRVRHTGWERLPDGDRLAEDHRTGWRLHLDHLRSHVEA